MRKRRTDREELNPLDVIEQAIHLLRRAPVSTLLIYCAGALPFILALLFFCSDLSRSAFAEEHLVGGAAGLAALFIWMKTWQAIFAVRLRAQLAGETPRALSAKAILATAAQQALLQPLALVLIPAAALVLFPAAWTIAFFKNLTVLGVTSGNDTLTLVRRSWREACLEPMQNHGALGVLLIFGLFVFLNVVVTLLTIPWLVKMLFGIETAFTLSIASLMNTTFFATTFGLAYLCLDPIVTAVYVLRCFHGESRETGEDLRVALQRFGGRQLAIVTLLALLCSTGIGANAATPPNAAQSESLNPAQLDRSIDDVLKRSEYTWRAPRAAPEKLEKKESALWNRVKAWLKDAVRAFENFLRRLFGGPAAGPGVALDFSLFSIRSLLYLLLALTVGVLLFVLWRAWGKSRITEAEPQSATPVPDLRDENVAADELPEDGWVRMGLELLERGELRLALRAFYLASLAHLAARDLIRIAKFKSNRDYEHELLRRSHVLPELSHAFSENVSVFDAVWYGRHDINDELFRRFRLNVERMKSC